MSNLRRCFAMIRLTKWFEKQVFIRLGDDQSTFMYTTRVLFISRFTIGEAERSVALELRNVAPLAGRVLDIRKHRTDKRS